MATNREWALKMIPVLVRWAQGTWDKPQYYSDLSTAVGHKTSQIGKVMEIIQDSFDNLQKRTGKRIPTLNSLVCSKSTGIPSDGFDYVIKDYSKLSLDSKKGEVRMLNHFLCKCLHNSAYVKFHIMSSSATNTLLSKEKFSDMI